jgi:hypothetical protein
MVSSKIMLSDKKACLCPGNYCTHPLLLYSTLKRRMGRGESNRFVNNLLKLPFRNFKKTIYRQKYRQNEKQAAEFISLSYLKV